MKNNIGVNINSLKMTMNFQTYTKFSKILKRFINDSRARYEKSITTINIPKKFYQDIRLNLIPKVGIPLLKSGEEMYEVSLDTGNLLPEPFSRVHTV